MTISSPQDTATNEPGAKTETDLEILKALDVEAKPLIVDTLYTGRGHQVAGRR